MEAYRVEFVLSGTDIDIDKLTKALQEVGGAVAVTRQDDRAVKVHLSATDPRKVFDRTSRFGKPTFIKIDEQSESSPPEP